MSIMTISLWSQRQLSYFPYPQGFRFISIYNDRKRKELPVTRAFLATILLVFANAAYSQTADHQPAFEVVSIRPAPPPDPGGGFMGGRGGPGTDDPGLFTCVNWSLANLVTLAYAIFDFQLSAPGWMQDQKFNVSAKVPMGATKEQFKLMMQNMLAERFKLAVHFEKKEMQRYELVIAKGGPKLKESTIAPPPKEDGAEPKPPEKPAAPKSFMAKDGYPAVDGEGNAMGYGRARVVYLRRTMEVLVTYLSAQLHHPVVDLTGLTGKYDIALFWDMRDASEPEAGPTLEAALQSQLGLKLEQKKGPVDIVVVDHAEKIPTEN
jgi:uncharacterized protein (TIGR03435 family)